MAAIFFVANQQYHVSRRFFMDTLFTFLFGMLLAGAGVVFAILAHDRSRERTLVQAGCPLDE